jgi:hypothetical protein
MGAEVLPARSGEHRAWDQLGIASELLVLKLLQAKERGKNGGGRSKMGGKGRVTADWRRQLPVQMNSED